MDIDVSRCFLFHDNMFLENCVNRLASPYQNYLYVKVAVFLIWAVLLFFAGAAAVACANEVFALNASAITCNAAAIFDGTAVVFGADAVVFKGIMLFQFTKQSGDFDIALLSLIVLIHRR